MIGWNDIETARMNFLLKDIGKPASQRPNVMKTNCGGVLGGATLL